MSLLVERVYRFRDFDPSSSVRRLIGFVISILVFPSFRDVFALFFLDCFWKVCFPFPLFEKKFFFFFRLSQFVLVAVVSSRNGVSSSDRRQQLVAFLASLPVFSSGSENRCLDHRHRFRCPWSCSVSVWREGYHHRQCPHLGFDGRDEPARAWELGSEHLRPGDHQALGLVPSKPSLSGVCLRIRFYPFLFLKFSTFVLWFSYFVCYFFGL